MRLLRGMIETPVARPGMRIGEALRICVDCNVPGIPFIDRSGDIAGRFSVRHAFLVSSITPDVIQGAHLIGHEALHLEHADAHYVDVFRRDVDPMIIDDIATLSPNAQVIKAIALMEKFDSEYLFVVDDGRYLGTVTRLGLTRVLLEGLR